MNRDDIPDDDTFVLLCRRCGHSPVYQYGYCYDCITEMASAEPRFQDQIIIGGASSCLNKMERGT